MELDNQPEVEHYNINFTEGTLAYNKGEYLSAAEFFGKLASKYPKDPDLHINQGNALFKMANFDGATASWKKARELDPHNVKTYINMGNLYFKQSKIDEALKEWEKGLLVSPTNPTVIINIASTHEKLGNKKKAFKLYEFFLECSTHKTKDYNQILKKMSIHRLKALDYMKKGVAFQKKQQYRNAVQSYLKSIEIYPVFKKSYLNLGSVCYILEKYENAVEYWLESYLLDNNNVNLSLNLALSYEKLEKYIDSYCFYERFIRKNNKNSPDYINAQKKKNILKEIIDVNTKMLISYKEESEAIFNENFFDKALIRFENLHIMTEDNSFLEKMTKIKIETELLSKAAVFAFETGNKYKTSGNIDKAVEFYKKCQALWPDGYYAKQSAEIITACGKIMGNAITAIMKANE